VKNSKIKILILGIAFLPLTLVFQNCGEVNVASAPLASEAPPSIPFRKAGEFCAPASLQFSVSQKIVLILDMSASNVLRQTQVPAPPELPRHFLGGSALDRCSGAV
jgi:hypothetical protein